MQGTSDARILWSRFPSRYYFAHVFKFNKQHFLQANNKKAGTLYILTSNDLPLQCSTERRIWIHVPPTPKKFSWRTSTSWTYKTGHRVIDLFIWYNYFSTGPEVKETMSAQHKVQSSNLLILSAESALLKSLKFPVSMASCNPWNEMEVIIHCSSVVWFVVVALLFIKCMIFVTNFVDGRALQKLVLSRDSIGNT